MILTSVHHKTSQMKHTIRLRIILIFMPRKAEFSIPHNMQSISITPPTRFDPTLPSVPFTPIPSVHLDTGAQRSVIGKDQAFAYCNDSKRLLGHEKFVTGLLSEPKIDDVLAFIALCS